MFISCFFFHDNKVGGGVVMSCPQVSPVRPSIVNFGKAQYKQLKIWNPREYFNRI